MNTLNRFANCLVALLVLALFGYFGWDAAAEFVANSTEQTFAYGGFGLLVAGIVVVGSLTLSPRRI